MKFKIFAAIFVGAKFDLLVHYSKRFAVFTFMNSFHVKFYFFNLLTSKGSLKIWKAFIKLNEFHLKVQSCKLYNGKYMIASTQITNTEIFAFIAVLVFKLLGRKVLFINRKDNRNC